MRKTCIVLQGEVYPELITELIETFAHIEHKILSTWDDQDKECLAALESHGFIVLVQPPPEYKCAVNYMVKSLQLGFKKAKTLGFTHAFRMRTDFKINDLPKLIQLLDACSTEKLGFMTMYQNSSGSPQYLTDHFAYGPLDSLSVYFGTLAYPTESRFPELFLMESYFKQKGITYDKIKDQIFLFQDICAEHRIQIYWTKPKYRYQGEMIAYWYRTNSFRS
jgi:hypothetical protein